MEKSWNSSESIRLAQFRFTGKLQNSPGMTLLTRDEDGDRQGHMDTRQAVPHNNRVVRI